MNIRIPPHQQREIVVKYLKSIGLNVLATSTDNDGCFSVSGNRVAGQSFGREPYQCKFDWPLDCGVQCGANGIVLQSGAPTMEEALADTEAAKKVVTGQAPHYRTAFFEAFPSKPKTFIRGEGTTIEEAELDAWNRYQKILNCPTHDFERRGRTDGYCFCKHCNLSGSFMEPTTKCVVCQATTNYTHDRDGKYYCEQHHTQITEDKLSDSAKLLRTVTTGG